jgi:hypothetical protein
MINLSVLVHRLLLAITWAMNARYALKGIFYPSIIEDNLSFSIDTLSLIYIDIIKFDYMIR